MIIILNGPPGSGKDTAARYLAQKGGTIQSFKEPIHRVTADLLDMSYDFYLSRYEQLKANGIRLQYGALLFTDLRQWYIHYSENIMKPIYGKDIFGLMAKKRLVDVNIFSDGGFQEEVDALGKVTLVHIHREGHTFKNDSRGWLPNPDYVIQNNENFFEALKCIK
jgi:dephospho-CoA kinase